MRVGHPPLAGDVVPMAICISIYDPQAARAKASIGGIISCHTTAMTSGASAFRRVLIVMTVVSAACGGEPDRSLLPVAVENRTDSAWVVQQATKSRVAIVFVHGIFGDAIDTWKHSNGSTLFNLINTVPGIAGQADMLAFGFPSFMFKSGSFDIREAANRLHLRLDFHGVLSYSKIVFVAHSMGGLVVLRELLTHADMRERVPVLVFFATPQEGAQITLIAQHILPNSALTQMKPADHNQLLQTISDEWNTIPSEKRPRVRCAYEKLPTHGVMIVPWASATRFCEQAPPPIAADHIGIVKADSASHDSVAVLATALKEYVFNRTLEPTLETPDFRTEGDHSVFDLTDATARQPARLVNSGGSSLRFTFAEVSDPKLYLWPDDTPKLLPGNSMTNMHIALGIGARAKEYRFVLRTDELPEKRVVVRVLALAALEKQQQQLLQSASSEVEALFADPAQSKRLLSAPADDVEGPSAVIRAVRNGVVKVHPDLPDSATWVLAADVLHASNWPALAAQALTQAEKVSPSTSQLPSVRRLAAETAALSGTTQIFSTATTPMLAPEEVAQLPSRNFLVAASGAKRAMGLASQMQQAPSLKAFGLSLQGDAQQVTGNVDAARQSFKEAATIRPTPSVNRRLEAVGGLKSSLTNPDINKPTVAIEKPGR
jgi:pimeloyl-ACP methyl ester carboxylesterase